MNEQLEIVRLEGYLNIGEEPTVRVDKFPVQNEGRSEYVERMKCTCISVGEKGGYGVLVPYQNIGKITKHGVSELYDFRLFIYCDTEEDVQEAIVDLKCHMAFYIKSEIDKHFSSLAYLQEELLK